MITPLEPLHDFPQAYFCSIKLSSLIFQQRDLRIKSRNLRAECVELFEAGGSGKFLTKSFEQ